MQNFPCKKKTAVSPKTTAVFQGKKAKIQSFELLLALMPISSKLLLSLMCRYLCALSFLSTRHSRTPYYNKFSYYAEFHILSQEKISIIAKAQAEFYSKTRLYLL